MSKVGAHIPTKLLSLSRLIARSPNDRAMDPTADHKNQSDGTFLVACSMLFATFPSG